MISAATRSGGSTVLVLTHAYPHTTSGDVDNQFAEALQASERFGRERFVSMAQLTIAWHLHQDPVTAPIVGVSSADHLAEAVEAVDISLSPPDLECIAEPSEPVPIEGHE
nr:aldo/keto reductase [Halovivax ruber]